MKWKTVLKKHIEEHHMAFCIWNKISWLLSEEEFNWLSVFFFGFFHFNLILEMQTLGSSIMSCIDCQAIHFSINGMNPFLSCVHLMISFKTIPIYNRVYPSIESRWTYSWRKHDIHFDNITTLCSFSTNTHLIVLLLSKNIFYSKTDAIDLFDIRFKVSRKALLRHKLDMNERRFFTNLWISHYIFFFPAKRTDSCHS